MTAVGLSARALEVECPRCHAAAGDACYDNRRLEWESWGEGGPPRTKRPHLDRRLAVESRDNEPNVGLSVRDAEVLAVCRRIVAAQAEDDALWATNLDGTVHASEAYLQQELRSLHAAVEGDLNAIAAIEDL